MDIIESLKEQLALAHERIETEVAKNAELEKLYAELHLHAYALTFGTDWNKGTHALLHGHRQGLIDAVKALMEQGK